MDYEIRRYEAGDFPGYAGLYEAVYHKKIDNDFFQWKNCDNPNSPDSNPLIYLAVYNGELVGSIAYFPYRAFNNGVENKFAQAGDGMVLLDQRGKGLFQKIALYAEEDLARQGYDLVYGFTNRNSHPGFTKIGFQTLYQVNLYQKIFNYQRVLNRRSPFLGWIGCLVDFTERMLCRCLFRNDFKIEECSLSDEKVGRFMNSSASPKIRIEKGLEYLKWRYKKRIDADYAFFAVSKGVDISGVFVVKYETIDMQTRATLAEYFVEDGQYFKNAVHALFGYLYKRRDLNSFIIWDLGDDRFEDLFKHWTLLKRRTELRAVFKSLKPEVFFPREIGAWIITAGDVDTI